MTVFGTSDWARTVPAHLPAGIAFSAGLGVGLPLIFVGSLVACFAATTLLLGISNHPVLGRRWWWLWLFLAGWVPVPAKTSWVYQWTVVY